MSGTGSISRKRVGSLSQSNQTSLPPLDIQSIQMPSNPQNSLAVKTAALTGTSRTLHSLCTTMRRRLRGVAEFGVFLLLPPNVPHLDVVQHMCHVFRLGSPLCHLYNLLIPSFVNPDSPLFAELPVPRPITYETPNFMSSPDGQGVVNWAKRPENAKTCQKYIAIFSMTMKQRREEGRWHGESWALHELWGKSTGEDMEAYDSTGLMKVLETVECMLDNLPSDVISDESPTTPHTAHSSLHFHAGPHPFDMPMPTGRSASLGTAELVRALQASAGQSVEPMPEGLEVQRTDSGSGGNAEKSVEELVKSEKLYVQELEILVRCSRELVDARIINADCCHEIFSNLSKILEFHRKFLIKLETEYEPIEEGQGPRAWAMGRWGMPFITTQSEFTCYGPYCANYLDAMRIVNEQMPNLLRGQALPENEGRPCLHPERELQAFMIKPIQRITKYQLLLDAILKSTVELDYPYRAELEQGAAAVRRIANTVNEITDVKAKRATVRDLIERVEDWKGHEVEKFGDLYLDEHFTVTKADQPREYHVFLFEKMMLCCKDVVPDRKEKKTKSALRKDKGRSNTVPEKKRLALKGRIFVCNINKTSVVPSNDMSIGRLTIGWTVPHRHPNGYSEDLPDYFVMTGKSDETLKRWADKVMELAVADRKRQDITRAERINAGRMSASSQFPTSQFPPPTPATEAPSFQFPPPLPLHGPYSPDEDDEAGAFNSGRTTPSIAGSSIAPYGYYPTVTNAGRRVQSQQSMPPTNHAELRARAMTEDQNGPSMTQWRQQANQPTMPPMPRMMSTQSAMSGMSVASEMSFGHSAGRPSIGRQMSTTSRLGPSEEVDEGSDHTATYSQRYPSQRGQMTRAPSHGVVQPSVPYPSSLLRNRSASSPNVYPQPQFASPLPSVLANPLPGMAEYGTETPDVASVGASSSTTLVGGTAYFTKRISGGGKRSSSESQSTETSESSSGPSPATPYASNTADLRGSVQVTGGSRHDSHDMGGGGGMAGGAAILLRVKCGECQFSLGVPFEMTYPVLHQKIQKKIRLFRGSEPTSLLLKWLDSEADEISLRCDADVEAMFDEARELGWGHISLIAKG